MTLEEQAEAIASREDFVQFVQSLSRVNAQKPEWWENSDLGSYLEAFGAWVAVMDKAYRNRGETLPSQPSWKMIAEMLLAATMYE
jgi:hypothetical protein